MVRDREVIRALEMLMDVEAHSISIREYNRIAPKGYVISLLKSRGLVEESSGNPISKVTTAGFRFYGTYRWLAKKNGRRNIKLVYTTNAGGNLQIGVELKSRPKITLYDFPLYAFYPQLE